jgi:hypothetical protein
LCVTYCVVQAEAEQTCVNEAPSLLTSFLAGVFFTLALDLSAD